MSKVRSILHLIAETTYLLSELKAFPNEPQLCWANTEDNLVWGRLWLSMTVISLCQSRQWIPLCLVYRSQQHIRRHKSVYCTRIQAKSYESYWPLFNKTGEKISGIIFPLVDLKVHSNLRKTFVWERRRIRAALTDTWCHILTLSLIINSS